VTKSWNQLSHPATTILSWCVGPLALNDRCLYLSRGAAVGLGGRGNLAKAGTVVPSIDETPIPDAVFDEIRDFVEGGGQGAGMKFEFSNAIGDRMTITSSTQIEFNVAGQFIEPGVKVGERDSQNSLFLILRPKPARYIIDGDTVTGPWGMTP
jgi:hypothetical protein